MLNRAFACSRYGSRRPAVARDGQAPQSTWSGHLANVKQLTAGGENAEAYFSPDGRQLIYQTNPGAPGTCDQIFTMNVDGSNKRQLSKGGRTTCGYFFPDGKSIVYASTHLGSAECPPRPSYARGYVWPIYDTYDIFRASPDGSNPRRLTSTPGYDAEATIGPDGRIVFTSVRDGDMEIYSMNADGSDVRRLTNRPGPTAARGSHRTATDRLQRAAESPTRRSSPTIRAC
jgi:Tol biopolymer transport system component